MGEEEQTPPPESESDEDDRKWLEDRLKSHHDSVTQAVAELLEKKAKRDPNAKERASDKAPATTDESDKNDKGDGGDEKRPAPRRHAGRRLSFIYGKRDGS